MEVGGEMLHPFRAIILAMPLRLKNGTSHNTKKVLSANTITTIAKLCQFLVSPDRYLPLQKDVIRTNLTHS